MEPSLSLVLVVVSYQLQTTVYQFLLSQLIKGFVKINRWALISGLILGIIGSRILYMSDNDGNLVVTSFCVLLATSVTLIVQAMAWKIFSKSN
jgi:TM2 domain-containing membrane protein YozV